MKKLIAMMLAGAMLFAATGCSSDNGGSTEDAVAKYGSDTLKLYNWGEYMGENLISDFPTSGALWVSFTTTTM